MDTSSPYAAHLRSPDAAAALLTAVDTALGRFTNFAAVLAANWATVEAHMASALSNSAADMDGSILLSAGDVQAMKDKIAAFGTLADKCQNVADGMVPPASITSPVDGSTSTATVNDGHAAQVAAQTSGDTKAQAPSPRTGDDAGNGGDGGGGSGSGGESEMQFDGGATGDGASSGAGKAIGDTSGDGGGKLAGTDVDNPLNRAGTVSPAAGATEPGNDANNVLDAGNDGEGDSTAQGQATEGDKSQAGAAVVEGDGGGASADNVKGNATRKR